MYLLVRHKEIFAGLNLCTTAKLGYSKIATFSLNLKKIVISFEIFIKLSISNIL